MIAFIVGMVVGAIIVAPILWRYRVEIKQSWQAALGVSAEGPAAVSSASRGGSDVHWSFSGKRWLAIGLLLVASLANAVLASQASNGSAIYVIGAALFAVAAGSLALTGRS